MKKSTIFYLIFSSMLFFCNVTFAQDFESCFETAQTMFDLTSAEGEADIGQCFDDDIPFEGDSSDGTLDNGVDCYLGLLYADCAVEFTHQEIIDYSYGCEYEGSEPNIAIICDGHGGGGPYTPEDQVAIFQNVLDYAEENAPICLETGLPKVIEDVEFYIGWTSGNDACYWVQIAIKYACLNCCPDSISSGFSIDEYNCHNNVFDVTVTANDPVPSQWWSVYETTVEGQTGDDVTIFPAVSGIQSGTTTTFTNLDPTKFYYIKHGVWIEGCFTWQETRKPLNSNCCPYIENVALVGNTYTNPSGASPTNYSNYTATSLCVPHIDPNFIYFSSNQENVYFALYIDYNKDGDFDDQDEERYNFFTNDSFIGEAIHNLDGGEIIRIIVSSSPITGPEEIPECGEMEDYISCDPCPEEPYIEPFWEFCDSYEVCELDDWPVHVLGTDNDALLEIEGYSFIWSTGSTADHIFGVMPSQEVTVQVTYPNGCIYNLTYIKDCCADNSISVSFNECPDVEMLPILENKLVNYIDGYSIPTKRELRTAIGTYTELNIEEYQEKGCDPCVSGWVSGTVLDGQGNPISNFDSITFTNNITNKTNPISQNNFTARVDTPYTVTVIVTNEFGIACTYTYDFIYECEKECSATTAPTNLQVSGNTLSWDVVPETDHYIITSPVDYDCGCEDQIVIPWYFTTTTNSLTITGKYEDTCFAWQVFAVCENGETSVASEIHCYDGKGVIIIDDIPVEVEGKLNFTENVTIVPNPTKGFMTFNLNANYDSDVIIEIYNYYGHKVKMLNTQVNRLRENSISWNGSKLEKGIYFISVITNKKTVYKQVVIR